MMIVYPLEAPSLEATFFGYFAHAIDHCAWGREAVHSDHATTRELTTSQNLRRPEYPHTGQFLIEM